VKGIESLASSVQHFQSAYAGFRLCREDGGEADTGNTKPFGKRIDQKHE
jgi:hypothetical protein